MLFALDRGADPMRVMRRNPDAIDKKSDGSQRIVEALADGQEESSSHLPAKMISKRIRINIHTASYIESRIWSGAVLVGFHPFETDLERKTIKAIGNLADNVGIMAKASSFGTNLASPVDLVYCCFVIDPEKNFAGGRHKVEIGTEMMEKFQDGGNTK
jgi:hypothetical protein